MKPVESDHAVSEPDPDADRERVSDLEDVAERQGDHFGHDARSTLRTAAHVRLGRHLHRGAA